MSRSAARSGESAERRRRPARLARLINLFSGLTLFAGIVLLYPPVQRAPHYEYKLGDVTQSGEDIISPIDFPLPVKPAVLAERRAAASLQVPSFYRLDTAVARQLGQKLEQLRVDVLAVQPQAGREPAMSHLLDLHPELERGALATLLAGRHPERLLAAVVQVVDSLLSAGVLDFRAAPVAGREGVPQLILISPGGERQLDADQVVDQDSLARVLAARAQAYVNWSAAERAAYISLARAHLRPNCFSDATETELRKRAVADAVPVNEIVRKGVRILGPNVQVTQEHLDRLAALEAALGKEGHSRGRATVLYAGQALLLLFTILLMLRVLLIYRRDFFVDPRRTVLLALLLLIFLAASKLVLPLEPGGAYLVPITFVAMLVAGLYDESLALLVTVFALVLLGITAQPPPAAILVGLLAGGAAIFSIRQLRSRLQLYRSVLYIVLAYLLGIAAVHLAKGQAGGILPETLRGMANGLVCAWLVMPILPLLERFFDLTTDFTLLELTDLNRPILKRMKVEAPGTFQHSLAVSNLAEAAADAIGANPLLAKVCAYYHDIGKLAKPDYFVENIHGFKNRHEKLTPNMSALIIGDHVKRGLDLAEQIKLPSIVRRGIPEHHGTTVMRFFYQKALEQDAHGQVTEDDFRYPGPKPQSAETAILMLADSVEATARTIAEPNTAAIRAVVTGAIDTRLREGQLEECGLSIRDLARIRESFVTTLLSIYHPRIKYPGEKGDGRAQTLGAGSADAPPAEPTQEAHAAEDRDEPELPDGR